MADGGDRRGVDVHRDGSRPVIHAVDAIGAEGERLAGPVGADAPGPAHRERLVGRVALDHEDADARAAVVVEARVPRLPPGVEPGLAVLAAPEQLEGARALAREGRGVDAPGRRASELGALLRLERATGVGEVAVARRHGATISRQYAREPREGAYGQGHPALLQLHVDQARPPVRESAHGAR